MKFDKLVDKVVSENLQPIRYRDSERRLKPEEHWRDNSSADETKYFDDVNDEVKIPIKGFPREVIVKYMRRYLHEMDDLKEEIRNGYIWLPYGKVEFSVSGEFSPAEGDGWNEPRYEAGWTYGLHEWKFADKSDDEIFRVSDPNVQNLIDGAIGDAIAAYVENSSEVSRAFENHEWPFNEPDDDDGWDDDDRY